MEVKKAGQKSRCNICGNEVEVTKAGVRVNPLRSALGERLDSLPRMADFALWATACETVLWTSGTFGAAYAGNRDEAVDSVIEADPVGSAIRSLIGTRTEWTGTASDLLGILDEEVGEKVRKSKAWPSSARALSGRVRRAATFLRKIGIHITFEREGRARTRTIRITRRPESAPAGPSIPSASSAQSTEDRQNNGFDQDNPRTVGRVADANTGHTNPGTVRDNHPENNQMAAADGTDASSQTHSRGWRTRL